MRHYLSYGGGVNSVALYLLMEQLGIQFEAVFVNHGTDWPETYEYLEYFIGTGRKVTVITPQFHVKRLGKTYSNLYQYCEENHFFPTAFRRWCTSNFKTEPFYGYIKKPAFVHVGIDAGEQHRAKVAIEEGCEKRYLLIEHGIDREGCKDIIREAGLRIPRKSGCFICPFQRNAQWRELRRLHPDLFCKAQHLEDQVAEKCRKKGEPPYYIRRRGGPLSALINDKQVALPGLEDEVGYPPCQCAR